MGVIYGIVSQKVIEKLVIQHGKVQMNISYNYFIYKHITSQDIYKKIITSQKSKDKNLGGASLVAVTLTSYIEVMSSI